MPGASQGWGRETPGRGAGAARAQAPARPTVKVKARGGYLGRPRTAETHRAIMGAPRRRARRPRGRAGQAGAGEPRGGLAEEEAAAAAGPAPALPRAAAPRRRPLQPRPAPPRASCAAPGAVLAGPSSSQRGAGAVGCGAAVAWEPGKFGRPLAAPRPGARLQPEHGGRADRQRTTAGPGRASRPLSGKGLPSRGGPPAARPACSLRAPAAAPARAEAGPAPEAGRGSLRPGEEEQPGGGCALRSPSASPFPHSFFTFCPGAFFSTCDPVA